MSFFDTKGKAAKDMTQDPLTGETVERHQIPEDLIKSIQQEFDTHAKHQNEFIMSSNQQVLAAKRQFTSLELIQSSEQRIKVAMQRACQKMKLKGDKWQYNIKDKCMELRIPPQVSPADYRATDQGKMHDPKSVVREDQPAQPQEQK